MQRRWLLIGIIITLLLVVGGGLWWWISAQQQANASKQAELDALQKLEISRNQFAASTNRQLWFTATTDKVSKVYAGDATRSTVVGMNNALATSYSNITPDAKHWYSIDDGMLQKHTGGVTTELGNVQSIPVKSEMAVSNTDAAVAWIAQRDAVQVVEVYNLETNTESTWFRGEANVTYDNLTWSPDGSELAFTADHHTIIMVNSDGAELTRRIDIAYIEWSSLTWITPDEFGAVASSNPTNPEPFDPFVAVLNRNGDITERHMVFDKVGIPKVVWHSTGTAFAFVDPWQNIFRIYNRYDQLIQTVSFPVVGKLTLMGLSNGDGPSLAQQTINTDSNTNSSATPTDDPTFTVTAEDWESFNTTVRGILGQWPIDFGTYRFNTNDRGLQISFQPPVSPSDPLELIAAQLIEQIFAVLPDVPAVSIQIVDATNTTVLSFDQVTREQAAALAKAFTGRTTEQLFVVNKEHPFGQRTLKMDGSGHHYVGDLVYSTLGDYNPYPALARLGGKLQQHTLYISEDDTFTIQYPTNQSIKQLDDRTTLIYGTNTTFVSSTAFGVYGLTIKRFDAPGITLEQWLSVNRSDSTTEPLKFGLPKPLTGVTVESKTAHTAEAVVLGNNNAYVFTVTRDAGITDDDRTALMDLVKSFSLNYVFQR